MARQRIWAALKKVARDIDDQFWNRTGPHGAAELGAALMNGNAYVMYGHSGKNDDGKKEQESEQQRADKAEPGPEQQQERERGGRSR
jgi:hypothetical protein